MGTSSPGTGTGNIRRLTGEFTDQAGQPADPTTATVQYQPAGSPTITDTPIRDSTGSYHYDVLLTVPGQWWYRFVGTGAVQAKTGDEHFYVPPDQF